ncbi:MAG: hypothetical protein HY074_05840 [Deltaproteobacteria bacterium]|nr:hypothetical protein [Deltaproteobacteria bacterium]
MRLISSIALSLAFSLPAFAINHAIVTGGCKINKENDAEFHQEANFVHDSFKAVGWKTSLTYGEGFTAAALQAMLNPDAFASNDQLLLSISSHGEEGPPHQICLGDGRLIDTTELKPLLDKLAAKGVKVSVVDNSCFSGGSVKALAGKNVCVVSATYDNVTSFLPSIGTSMTGRLLAKELKNASSARAAQIRKVMAAYKDLPIDLKALGKDDAELEGKGMSLEELFLSARSHRGLKPGEGMANNYSPPQISSDVGNGGFRLREAFPAYFDFFSMKDKAKSRATTDAFFKKDYFSAAAACAPDNPFTLFIEFMANLDSIANHDKVTTLLKENGFADLEDVRNQFKDYVKRRGEVWQTWKKASAEHNAVLKELDQDENSDLKDYLLLAKKKAALESSAAAFDDPTQKGEIVAKLKALEDHYHVADRKAAIESDPKLNALFATYKRTEAAYDQAQALDAKTSGEKLYPKLETVFYQAQYLKQRQENKKDEKAKACSDFSL